MKDVVGNDPTKIANSISNGENFLEIKSRTIFLLLFIIIKIIIIYNYYYHYCNHSNEMFLR